MEEPEKEENKLMKSFSFLLPNIIPLSENLFVDIDGSLSSFDDVYMNAKQPNIFIKCLYGIMPILIPPIVSMMKLKKLLKMLLSFSSLLSVILIATFILELFHCGVSTFKSNPLLGPDANTVYTFGAKYSYGIMFVLILFMIVCLTNKM